MLFNWPDRKEHGAPLWGLGAQHPNTSLKGILTPSLLPHDSCPQVGGGLRESDHPFASPEQIHWLSKGRLWSGEISTCVLHAPEAGMAPLHTVFPGSPPSDPPEGLFHLLRLWVPLQSDFGITVVFFC